jgi:uncharacterized protein (TIGR03086 family)
MTPRLDDPVGLLERSLDYTCAQLATVRDDLLDRRTPCAGWRLVDLLAHMEDALDTFTEAAGGRVRVHAGPAAPAPVAAIRVKAGGLLEAWSRPAPGDVVLEARCGRLDLDSPLLVATAALEVAVHGWDVGRSTGSGDPLPDELAAALLPVARATVAGSDRGLRFAAPRPVAADAPPAVRLLGFLGRA